ncbi:MAG: phospholipid-binding protein [Nodosilinea sp.]
MSNVVQSLVATGKVISGICYTSADGCAEDATGLPAIPPERVGLHGEYDYYGLAKRIQARFYTQLGRSAVGQVMVRQRGSAVILSGRVESQALLEQLVQIAIQADGATHVEVRNVQVKELDYSEPLVLTLA